MLQGADELSRADEHTDQTHLSSRQSLVPSSPPVTSSPEWPSPTPPSPPDSSAPLSSPPPAPPADLVARLAGGEARQEFMVARETRAAGLVGGLNTAQIAAEIQDRCGPLTGT